MYQQRNGRQFMVIGAVVILLVLAAAYFLSRGGGGSKNASSAPPMSSIVVALQAVPQGTQFAAGQPLDQFFGMKQVPTSMIPFGAYTTVQQISNLIRSVGSTGCSSATSAACRGQVTVTQTIYQNLPVVSGMFSTLGQFRLSAGPAFQIPYGYVAIGVSFAATNSVLGSVQPGDDVDLLASLTGLEGSDGNKIKVPTQTQYVLNDVRVIGVNGPPPPPSSTTSGSSASGSSSNANNGAGGQLLLMVRYQQALIIQHLKDFGGSWTISVVLRSSKETDIPHFKTMPVTERWFFVKQENHFDWANPY